MIDCSSGGIGGAQKPGRMPLAQGFQVDFAAKVREEAEIPTMAVGMIWDPAFANDVIKDGNADLVALAREVLDDPNWTLHAAKALGHDPDYSQWDPAFGWWLNRRERAVKKLGLRD